MKVRPVFELVVRHVDVSKRHQDRQTQRLAALIQALDAVVGQIQRRDGRRQSCAVSVADEFQAVVREDDGLEVRVLRQDRVRQHEGGDVVEGKVEVRQRGEVAEDGRDLAPAEAADGEPGQFGPHCGERFGDGR